MSHKAEKKIPFNHKNHLVKYGAECASCHGYYDNGRFKGTPSVAECVACHDREAPDSNDPLTPKRKEYFAKLNDTNRPWDTWAKQPDLVYFSHAVVMTARFEDGRLKSRCGSCHGDKANSINTDRIKGKMLMGQCMDCHTALNISNSCAVCHD
jgi:cytochrome c553